MQPRSEPRPTPFPVVHVAAVPPAPPETRWLVEGLWAASGVGIVGGAPKCGKTWLAAELALAVATGGDALGRYPARVTGPVLFFGAEDSQPALRERFAGLASARSARLGDAPIFLLDVHDLRLDLVEHVDRLRSTIAELKPRLLVLDPFVRLARVDENSASEVSAVLAALRSLQRELDLAVLLAHHMRKSPSPHLGQALRGSSDFHAWGDSNLFLSRHGDRLRLVVEHRNAAPLDPLSLKLEASPTPHLVVLDEGPVVEPADDGLARSALALLSESSRPRSTVELREALHVRKGTLVAVLEDLRLRGVIVRLAQGWALAEPPSS